MASHTGLTITLAATAAAVGGLLIAKKYIHNFLVTSGNPPNHIGFKKPLQNHLVIERILDANCNGYELRVGVDNKGVQSISVRPGELKRLLDFKQSSNSLQYEFEDSVLLSIKRDDGGQLYYKLIYPDGVVEKPIQISYKPIYAFSTNLDHIYGLEKQLK